MITRNALKALVVVAGCWLGISGSQAAVLVTDNFTYSGTLTNNGWVAYSGADGSVTSDTFKATVGGGAEDIRLSFTDQLTGPTFASFTINVGLLPASGSEYSFGFVDASVMESRFGLLSVGGTAFRLTAWGTQGTAALATNNVNLLLNTDYHVIYYFDGTNDHRLWIDSDGTDFLTPDIQAAGTNNGIDGVFIRQAGALDLGAARWTMDNLIVGTAFADVLSGPAPISTNVKFSASSGSIGEAGGSVTVTVFKTETGGDVSGEITLAGTATEGAGNDYTLSATNFTLNGATTSATFVITINDDAVQELSETVVLGLANVVGGIVVAPNQFTLTITDNDTVAVTGLMISQYTETETGTTPKGIEVWNNTGAPITFDSTINKLEVKVATGGGSPNSAIIVTNGTLGTNEVLVIGTADMNPDVEETFTYNGDDAVVLEFGGFVVDVIGTVGNDPGVAWTNNGVSTKDQNIQLKTTIFTNDPDGWLDPSERFEAVSVGSVLTGFGTAPGATPIIPTNVTFLNAGGGSASEDVGSVTVFVTKSIPEGNVSGQITFGGTSTEGLANDYTLSSTNFTMNGTTTSAFFSILINDDAINEAPENIILILTNVTGGQIASPFTYTLFLEDNDAPPAPTGGVVWINEFQYDPPGTDSNEFVEIAGPAGTDLGTYTVYWYNGGDGLIYGSNQLSGVIDDESCGFGALSFPVALQNGNDGLALVKDGTNVLRFISYEGSFIAANGPALGLSAEDVFLTTINTNLTIQLVGTGVTERAFALSLGEPSPGSLNSNQVITGCGPAPATNVSFSIASAMIGEQSIGQVVYVVKNLAEGDVSGQIAISGTATEGPGNDFTVGTTNFTLNGTTTSNMIVISVNNDTEVESNETVVLTLANVVGGTPAAPTTFTLTIVDNDLPPLANGPVWINEFNYDDVGADSNEFIEVAGPAGTDLSIYTILYVNGGDGTSYGSLNLSGVIDDEGCGFGAVSFLAPGLQNGAPDGLALVSNGLSVIQFVSYEGAFTGTNGLQSVNAGTDLGAGDDSLQLAGSGDAYADFAWVTNTFSAGSLNVGQTITPCGGGGTTLDEYEVTQVTIAPGLVSATIAVTSNGVPYSLLFTTNLTTAPVPTGTADTEVATGGPVTLQDTSTTQPQKYYWIRTND